MRSKDNHSVVDFYTYESSDSKDYREFKYLYYYHEPFKKIDCRFINFMSTRDNIRQSIEQSVYKLIALNPQLGIEDFKKHIKRKLHSYTNMYLSTHFLERDVDEVCDMVWNNLDDDKALDIYSYGSVIWKSQEQLVSLLKLTKADIEYINDKVSEYRLFKPNGAEVRLTESDRETIRRQITGAVLNGKKGAEASRCRAKMMNRKKRDLVMAAIDQLMEEGRFLSVENIAEYSTLGYDVVRKHIKNLQDITNKIRTYNLGNYGVDDGRSIKKQQNIKKIVNYIISTGDVSKKSISENTKISRRTVYNLWDEVEKHLSK